MPLLDIKNLTLTLKTGDQWVNALDKVSLTLERQQVCALIGESGSGKSLLVRTIADSTPHDWKIVADRFNWKGQDLLSMTNKERREIMRREIAVVFQDPSSSLDPTVTLGSQLEESVPSEFLEPGPWYRRRKQRRERALALMAQVGIKQADFYLDKYPNQISQDICQKFMIAMALVSQPEILIADDPTRGMESIAKQQVIQLFAQLRQLHGMSILLVSHDLLTVAKLADTATVMYCGQTVESGRVSRLRRRPLHPYTKALLDSAPSFQPGLTAKTPLSALGGSTPALNHLPAGCRLGPRCPNAGKDCVRMPRERRVGNQTYACHFPLHRHARAEKPSNGASEPPKDIEGYVI